jgi:DNA repair protein SbcC/Rad50
MRPVRLRVKGFTAFRDEQDVDFTDLDLFAVVGPTGSGKSSLLDAVTFVLYGEVDRLDKRQVRAMVSQGQPRMAVVLEFEVDGRRYRVARSMPSGGGATKILLEREVDGGWRQYGEGADRVREADVLIRDLVGLDFDAFTRSVMLPQGKFAAFLAGDASERRRILTELLGLSLFQRIGERARQMAREATDRAATIEDLMGRDYVGVSDEALAQMRKQADAAAERETALRRADDAVRAVADRWRDAQRQVSDLRDCAGEAATMARTAVESVAALLSAARRMGEAERSVAERAAEMDGARSAAETLGRARNEAETDWGTVATLAALRARAETLVQERSRLEERRRALEASAATRPDLDAAARAAEERLAEAADRAAAAQEGLQRSQLALSEVRRADEVAALVHGHEVGDPCPVCGSPLSAVPVAPGARAVATAEKALDQARRAGEKALAEAVARKGARDGAVRRLEEADMEARRCAVELRTQEKVVAAGERELTGALGEEIPPDPVAVLSERMSAIQDLERALAEAEARAQEAERALLTAREVRDEVGHQSENERTRLASLGIEVLMGRATRLAGTDLDRPVIAPELPPVAELPELIRAAESRSRSLTTLRDALTSLADRRAGSEAELLAEAEDATGDLVPSPGSLEGLVAAVGDAREAAVKQRATHDAQVEQLQDALDRMSRLVEEVGDLRVRAARFKALALELQADRLIAFLQQEALRLLAVGGSRRLSALSGGRYDLVCRNDEFWVIDRWNGDDERNVRTLSGGETFLASLALALALSEQVRSLAVTDRASLDSLFLDEGFGTLDPESLEAVVEGIEQLGGDGRMVGVITHVRELADRLPVRIEVEKSPRGSRLRVVQ